MKLFQKNTSTFIIFYLISLLIAWQFGKIVLRIFIGILFGYSCNYLPMPFPIYLSCGTAHPDENHQSWLSPVGILLNLLTLSTSCSFFKKEGFSLKYWLIIQTAFNTFVIAGMLLLGSTKKPLSLFEVTF